jgi:deoxyribonuclease-4
MSTAGGLHTAFKRGASAGCDCMQVFVRNQRQWRAPPLSEDAIRGWHARARVSRIQPVVAHASYLFNLASGQRPLRECSMRGLVDELERCEALGIAALVVHPGAAGSGRPEAGLRRIVRAVDQVCRSTRGFRVLLLLETTAGQGTALGARFEELAYILDGLSDAQRVHVCLDTCHIFAAGYPLSPADAYAHTIDALDRKVGLERIRCIHLNDSGTGCGSRVDRHAHIGQGHIGLGGFGHLVRDQRLRRVPMILETPKGLDARGRDLDRVNLQRLRRLARSPRA